MSVGIERYLEKVRTGGLVKPNRCAICARAGSLSWHGTYQRSLITLKRKWTIPIKRLYCRLCDHTFALLPAFVMKFHRYACQTIRSAVRRLRSQTYDAVADWLMQVGSLEVATLTLYFWRRKFA